MKEGGRERGGEKAGELTNNRRQPIKSTRAQPRSPAFASSDLLILTCSSFLWPETSKEVSYSIYLTCY